MYMVTIQWVRGRVVSAQFTCGSAEKVYVRQDDLGRLAIVPEPEGKRLVQRAEKILDNF